MKKSRFTDAQILAILKQGEGGVPVADLCRKHGISNATFYIYGRLSRRKRFEICFDLNWVPTSIRRYQTELARPNGKSAWRRPQQLVGFIEPL
jgi:putative transposase